MQERAIYSYKWRRKLILILPTILFSAVLLYACFELIAVILTMVEKLISSRDIIGELLAVPMWLFVISIFSIPPALLANSEADIQVSQNGVYVQIFMFWWSFVPWKDIVDIRNSIVAGPRTQIVIVRRLTPIHRMFGLMYAFTFRPAFRITRKLQGYHEAMRTIRERTGIKY